MTNTIYEIRRENLRRYIAESSSTSIAIARQLGMQSGSYLSQIVGNQPTRKLHEDKARDFEKRLNLPAGWLDIERDAYGNELGGVGRVRKDNAAPEPAPKVGVLDHDRVVMVAAAVSEFAAELNAKIGKDKMSDIIRLALEFNDPDCDALRNHIRMLVKLAA